MMRRAAAVAAIMIILSLFQCRESGAWLFDSDTEAPIAGADIVVLGQHGRHWQIRTEADGRIPFPPGSLEQGDRPMLICVPDRRPVTMTAGPSPHATYHIPKDSAGYLTLREEGWTGPIPSTCMGPDLVQRFKPIMSGWCKLDARRRGGRIPAEQGRRREI